MVLPFTQFYPGFTQLPRVKLGKTVLRFYPPTLIRGSIDFRFYLLTAADQLSAVQLPAVHATTWVVRIDSELDAGQFFDPTRPDPHLGADE